MKTWQPKPKKSDRKDVISKATHVEDKENTEQISSEIEVQNDQDEDK